VYETILMPYNCSTPDSVLKQTVMVSREIHTMVVCNAVKPYTWCDFYNSYLINIWNYPSLWLTTYLHIKQGNKKQSLGN